MTFRFGAVPGDLNGITPEDIQADSKSGSDQYGGASEEGFKVPPYSAAPDECARFEWREATTLSLWGAGAPRVFPDTDESNKKD